MTQKVLLGDEAVALAAIHCGITAAYAYPGTPSTEILEYLQRHARESGVAAHWSVNEKTAYEQALGVSLAGHRVLVSMKHVGLNVAADPFVNSALVSVNGGLVLAVADDPGMHTTPTIDIDVVLSGEIWMEVDHGKEVHLKQGDVLIQNGTRHRWTNRTNTPTVM